MCQVANREKEGWLDTEHIKSFPCEDLQTIDQLWMHYSNSKFGFSIQKKLWVECGGKYDYEVWKKFAEKIGWYYPQNNEWRTYTQFMDDTRNAQNALPASLPLDFLCCFVDFFGRRLYLQDILLGYMRFSYLSQRLVNCNR